MTKIGYVGGVLAICGLWACGGDNGAAPDAGGGGGGGGHATLTIGTQTWEFDSFGCAIGLEQTGSQVYSFNSNSIGSPGGGARLQMQAEIRDDSGEGRLEGDGVVYLVYIQDIDDFENPSVYFESSSEYGGETTVTISGDQVNATGLFDDMLTDELVLTEGTLEGTCGQ
jgi:hypothetical protein